MAGDPVSSGCGCALALVVLAVGVGAISAWAFLVETGLVYWLAAGLMVWLVLALVRRIRRHYPCRSDPA
jgi:hypothetical protein